MIQARLKKMFSKDQDDSILVHTVLSFVYRGSGILANLMMVPLALNMLDSAHYGVWLAIGAVITWFNFLDVGLGNGLRNLSAEALAMDDVAKVQKLFATSFWSIGTLVLLLIAQVLFVFPVIPWNQVFNVHSISQMELVEVMQWVASGFLMGILLRLTISLYLAHQVHSIQALVNCLVQVGSYLGVLYLVHVSEKSLVAYAKMLSGVPLFFLLLISVVAFAKRFKVYFPWPRHFQLTYMRPVLGLGVSFIVLQLMWMLITTTDSYLIAYWLSPEEVVPFSVSFKYFGIINIGFVLIMTPYWSSFTQAYAKGELYWIKQAQKRIQKMVMGFLLLGILLFLVAPWVISFWMSGQVETSWHLNFAMFVFSILYMYLGSKNYFLNGIGKLKVQMRVLMVTAILHILLAYWWGVKLHGGVEGILWGTNVAILINVIVSTVQVNRINNGNAKGIWNQ